MFAAEIRRKRVQRMPAFTHWRWRLDEVYVKINGEMHYLWRAIDEEGEVLLLAPTPLSGDALAFDRQRQPARAGYLEQGVMVVGLQSQPVGDGLLAPVLMPCCSPWPVNSIRCSTGPGPSR